MFIIFVAFYFESILITINYRTQNRFNEILEELFNLVFKNKIKKQFYITITVLLAKNSS